MRTPRNERSTMCAVCVVMSLAVFAVLLVPVHGHATGVGVRGAWVDRPDSEENTQMVGGFFRLGRALALEGAVDYRREELGGGAEVRTWPVTASLVASPIPFLYGLAGVGWYNTTLELPSTGGADDRTEREFGYHIGAGTRVPIVPSLSFLADLRYAYVDYQFDEFGEAVSNFDGGNYLTLNLGIMLSEPL